MPRSRSTSFLEDVITLASRLPWWGCLLLAPVSYAGFHRLAAVKMAAATPAEGMIRGGLFAIGIAGQFLGPLVFVVAAAVSGFGHLQRKRLGGTDDDLYDTWKDVSKTEPSRPSVDTSRWSMDLLKALEWKRFELLCAGYFETLGFKAKVAREGADGGIDIHLYPEGSDAPGIVVQCKAWNAYQVGVKPIRELLGVMTADRISEGVFVTTSDYTGEARRFAEGNNLQLIDGEDFLKKIAATLPEQQAALLQLATAGDFTTPTCPSCGIKMVERVAQKTGERFWGCPSFPSCRRTFRRTSG